MPSSTEKRCAICNCRPHRTPGTDARQISETESTP